jgi:hypothetical protein
VNNISVIFMGETSLRAINHFRKRHWGVRSIQRRRNEPEKDDKRGGGQSYVFAPPTLFGFLLEKSVVHIIIA